MRRLWHFISKYKVLHILFWLGYFIVTVHMRAQYRGGSRLLQVPPTLILVASDMISVYTIIWYLFPRFITRRKYLQFALAAFIVVVLVSVVETAAMEMYFFIFRNKVVFAPVIGVLSSVVDISVICVPFIAISLFQRFYELDKKNKLLEKDRLETELSFLKAQINPHFMFNALNSIYIMIRLKKDLAEDTVLRFSNLMRYLLYECSGKSVGLERELVFLDDYITLEKLRQGSELKVCFEKPANASGIRIPPFLLIPFVENAFKHVSRSMAENFINIEVSVEQKLVRFSCSNSYDGSDHSLESGGIGLQNIQRRLALLYPDDHTLSIDPANSVYLVNLTIHAIEDELPGS